MSYRREARVSENTWILVADRSKAMIFEAIWPDMEYYRKIHEFENPTGFARSEDTIRDRPGRLAGAGMMRSIGEPPTNYRHRSAQEMALAIIEHLEQGRTNHQFGRLIVIAPALLLGVLRDRMPTPLSKTVVLTLRKHLVDVRIRELMEQVNDGLAMNRDQVLVS